MEPAVQKRPSPSGEHAQIWGDKVQGVSGQQPTSLHGQKQNCCLVPSELVEDKPEVTCSGVSRVPFRGQELARVLTVDQGSDCGPNVNNLKQFS